MNNFQRDMAMWTGKHTQLERDPNLPSDRRYELMHFSARRDAEEYKSWLRRPSKSGRRKVPITGTYTLRIFLKNLKDLNKDVDATLLMKGPPVVSGPNCYFYDAKQFKVGNPYYTDLVVQLEIYEDGLALLSSKSSADNVAYKSDHVWFH